MSEAATQKQPSPFATPLEEARSKSRAIRRLKSDPVDDSLDVHVIGLTAKSPMERASS